MFCAKNSLTIIQDKSTEENLNLADLDLKKLRLSDEDALALSYLTPGLSKRIQKQLLAQLAPSEARKLHRTLSCNSNETPYEGDGGRKTSNRLSSTLPRRYSINQKGSFADRRNITDHENVIPEDEQVTENTSKVSKPYLPSQSRLERRERRPYSDFSVRSASIEYEPSYRRPRISHSVSLREPRVYSNIRTSDNRNLQSPDSSISESLSQNDTSSYKRDDSVSDLSSKVYSFDNYPSLSRPSSYVRYSTDNSSYDNYLSLNKPYEPSRSATPNLFDSNKTETVKPSTRRISRFLRPDFFDTPKEESVFVKEKKEREMETQKVLKEIRDKRKSRLIQKRERSKSREKTMEPVVNNEKPVLNKNELKENMITEVNNGTKNVFKDTSEYLENVSNNIRKLESNVNNNNNNNSMLHDYVNVPSKNKIIPEYVNVLEPEPEPEGGKPVMKKEKFSRLARPKSYPNETSQKISVSESKERSTEVESGKSNDEKEKPAKVAAVEKESKISRLRKGFVRQGSKERDKTKEIKNETNKIINEEEKSHKNKLLQTIEKKLEKFRASNSSVKESDDNKLSEKKSSVENAIRKLREQSLPRNIEPCTESGLIKRAVSVEDLSNFSGNKPLQASRKSVTKILGLFKKYEDQDGKKNEKVVKKKKSKESSKGGESSKLAKIKKEGDKKSKESVILSNANCTTESGVNSNGQKKSSDGFCKTTISSEPRSKTDEPKSKTDEPRSKTEKPERPRSLLLDKMKHFQQYNGAKSDSTVSEKELKTRNSKLPVNTFRRSLNLDSAGETPKSCKSFVQSDSSSFTPSENDSEKMSAPNQQHRHRHHNEAEKPSRENLRLNLTNHAEPKIVVDQIPCSSVENANNENRNSFTTDDSSVFLSPCDDNVSDSWSVCSDYQTHDLYSPTSPSNGNLCSGDESESVIDRIRRKSFYTRFNENKRPRKSSLTRNYKDLDGYNTSSSYKSLADYGSLDRRNYDYKPVSRRSSFASGLPEPRKDYKTYARSSSLLNDYVNVPNRYQTYSSRIGRPASCVYSDIEDNATDDRLTAAKPKKYSASIQQSSRLGRASISPFNEQLYSDHPSSSVASNLSLPTSPEPL